jgi:hypothetical protein
MGSRLSAAPDKTADNTFKVLSRIDPSHILYDINVGVEISGVQYPHDMTFLIRDTRPVHVLAREDLYRDRLYVVIFAALTDGCMEHIPGDGAVLRHNNFNTVDQVGKINAPVALVDDKVCFGIVVME